MKHLKRFNESKNVNIYEIDWHTIVPRKLTMVYSNQPLVFVCNKDTNIMKHSDLIQITYTPEQGEVWGKSDCLEFDLHFLRISESGEIKLDIDITWGNFMESEFSIIPPDNVSVILCTSKDSLFDPTNTVFAFDDRSLNNLVNFFNQICGISITTEDLNFLHIDGRCPK